VIPGRLIYRDNGKAKLLVSKRDQMGGKPDAITKTGFWFFKDYRPVEYKSMVRATKARPKDVIQLMAQGLLIEAQYGKYPKVGYLEYASGTIPIRMGNRSRRWIRAFLKQLRSGSHPVVMPGDRCQVCPLRGRCPVVS
jgi:CRISPR/Cas system-associated exonuclease Cas4 (RecB family)